MRFSKEVLAISIGAFTALAVGQSETTRTYPARSPLPAALYEPRAGKRVACFITINSSDEKEVFTQHLNPAEWDLVELTEADERGSKFEWFDRACAKNIRCDINVISGHFAGRFFGSSGFSLELDDLEAHSCAQDCRGILNEPREVYLFGCNTLATKERDHRSPEEYYQVLINDDYSPETARRVVEDRYGSFGQDNRGKIRRSFAGVPYIYGFFSTSPLGKVLRPVIHNYFQKLGDYTKHFDELVRRGGNATKNPNAELRAAMSGKSFAQCGGIDPGEPEYTFHRQICMLFDKSIPIVDRLLSVEVMLNSEHVLMLLPSIQHFFEMNVRDIKATQPEIFARLRGSQNARNILLDAIVAVKTPITKMQWMRFAELMGWMKHDDLIAAARTIVERAFEAPIFDADTGEAICALNIRGLDQADFRSLLPKIKEYHFNSVGPFDALRCVGMGRYPEFRAQLNAVLKTRIQLDHSDLEMVGAFMANLPPVLDPTSADRELLTWFKRAIGVYLPGQNSLAVGQGLAKLGATDPDVGPILRKIFLFSLSSVNRYHQIYYADAFESLQAGQDALEDVVLESVLNPRNPERFRLQHYFMVHPIRGTTNQARILDALTSGTDSRGDEMVFALREMRMPLSQFLSEFQAFRAKAQQISVNRVFLGWLHLALNAGADSKFIENLFELYRSAPIANEEELRDFYAALRLPRMRELRISSPTVRTTICAQMKSAEVFLGPTRYDALGDPLPRKVPLLSCGELILED